MKDPSGCASHRYPRSFVEFSRQEIEQSIPERFAQQVARRPDGVAVEFQDRLVTYDELNRAANRAAREVEERHPAGDAPVALLVDQGVALIVSILAVLKAGRSYAPLDRRQPTALLENTVEDLQPGLIVSDGRNLQIARALADVSCPVLNIETVDASRSGENLDLTASADSPACVFYTSGSTGEPKGVVDTHRNVLHNVMRYTNSLGFSPTDRMSLVQHSSFSGTVSTLFGALLNGATVCPLDLDRQGLAAIGKWAARKCITVFHSVPSIFRHLVGAGSCPELRLIRLEGDEVKLRDIEIFQETFTGDCVLVNGLGATECGLVRQYFVGRDTKLQGDVVPVGYPVEGMDVRVVDASGDEVPAGSIGEVSVRSPYLAMGYWKKPELTAARFEHDVSGRRNYRTGDLGRMDSGGCLEHLGRRDFQTKIGGARVDLSDVERVLLRMETVSDAVVQARADRANEAHLVAYLVPEKGAKVTVTEVREYLETRLARHMIPTACVFLERLPLTADGKVDRGGLPAPTRGRPVLGTHYVVPGTLTEQFLADLWAEVLELESKDVGVLDSFFDLGGESRRAGQIAARISQRFDRELSAVDLFEHRTIRTLARYLDGAPVPKLDRLAGLSERAAKQSAALTRRRETDWRKHVQ